MLTTIPPTLHSPGRPRTPAQAPHQRLLALSPPPPPPAAALPRRAGRPQLCAVAGATSGRPAPHPRHPHAALAAPQARPPAASAARLWGALSPPCGSRALGCPRPGPTATSTGSRQPGSCPSRERGARGGQPPVRRSRLGWAEPARARAPGRQGRRGRAGGAGGRVDGGQDGPPRSPRASGRTGPGGGTREEKEDKEEKEEKEGPGGRRTFGQRGGGARDQKRACLASPSGNRTPVSRVTGARHVPRATAHPARPPGRRVSAHSSPPARLGASRPRTRRPAPAQPARGMAAGEKTPDTSPLEAWVRIPLLTRPPFGPPNAGSPHPGLDDALSVPPYTPLRAAGCGLRAGGALAHVARDPRSCSASALPATGQPRAEDAVHRPRAGRATLPLRGALARLLALPAPPTTSPPPARRERGVPQGLSFSAGPPFFRGGQQSPPRASQRRDPRPVAGLARGGRCGVHPAVVAPGSPERKAVPASPGPLPRRKAAAGPGLQDASALPSPRRPPSQASRRPAPPKRTCRPHPHRSPAGPDGELRAELTRLSLASWLGRYSAAPISDDDTDADTHTRAPTLPPPPPRGTPGAHHNPSSGPQPAPAGAHCTGRRAIRPWDSVWRRPRPRERAQGEPSPPRGLAGTVGAARRPEPEPEPEPEPSAHLHGRGACLADRGPPPAPAQRVLTTGRAGTTTSAAGEAVWWPPPPVHGWFSGRILACHAGGPGFDSRPMQRAAPFWPRAPGFLAHALKPQGLSLNQLCSRRGPCPPAPPRFPLPTCLFWSLARGRQPWPPRSHPAARPLPPDVAQVPARPHVSLPFFSP
ncbi:basic proline-rich protein-like [Canis lupus familiaris]|uniref:basic proline-rich protein-like n=1 Tax=Canis lupus familiaris TaxID=9615 RepID=UPI0018F5FA2B|nr:basic proline-rich protein-like [Canis lupus familiaris]